MELAATRPAQHPRISMVIGRWCAMAGYAVAFLTVYLGLDLVSYVAPIRPFDITSWNPGLGFCVAVTALWGWRAMPLVAVAPVLADAVNRTETLPLLYSLGVAAITTIETAMIVVLSRWMQRVAAGKTFARTEIILLVAAAPASFISALFHAGSLRLLGFLRADQLVDGINRLWVGDVIGVSIVTPLCLILPKLIRTTQQSRLNFGEILAQAAAVVLTLWVIFGPHRNPSGRFYVLYLPTLWIVLRHGLQGTILLNSFVQIAIITSFWWLDPSGANITLFQAKLLVFTVTSLTLGLAIDEIGDANRKLRAQDDAVAASLKAAATSELAGALAHELSHPLGAISNYASAVSHVVTRSNDSDVAVAPLVQKLLREVERATEAVHHLRDFFSSGALAVESVDLGDIAREAVSLLGARLASDSISIRLSVRPGANILVGDKVQIHAVIHNLLINAIDALASIHPDRRQILVTVARTSNAVSIAVEDSGAGVPADVADHIFEPLITTKKDGLGLGLSMSKSIATAHGGSIELVSSGLGGAGFVVKFPPHDTADGSDAK